MYYNCYNESVTLGCQEVVSEPTPPPPPSDGSERTSPLHPKRPDAFRHDVPNEAAYDDDEERRWASEPNSPGERLEIIRQKMREVANEYANQEISRAQFHAIYAHYNEQRTIIEQIISRNPNNPGWKQAARSGKTEFLRTHYEAYPQNYVIYVHQQRTPLMGGGTKPDMARIQALLRTLWNMDKLKVGVARLALGGQAWLIMAAGHYSVTFVTFQLEPSGNQANAVRDLHEDFERANRLFFQRNKINKARMVFPQRALIENKRMA
jgi:hypothetical protein